MDRPTAAADRRTDRVAKTRAKIFTSFVHYAIEISHYLYTVRPRQVLPTRCDSHAGGKDSLIRRAFEEESVQKH